MSSSFVGALTYTSSSDSSGIIFGFTPPFLIIPEINGWGASVFCVNISQHEICQFGCRHYTINRSIPQC